MRSWLPTFAVRKAPKSQRGSGRIVEKRSKICLVCSIFSQIEYWIHRLEETRRRSEDARGMRGIKRWMSANSLSGTQRSFFQWWGVQNPLWKSLEIPTDFTNPYGFWSSLMAMVRSSDSHQERAKNAQQMALLCHSEGSSSSENQLTSLAVWQEDVRKEPTKMPAGHETWKFNAI